MQSKLSDMELSIFKAEILSVSDVFMEGVIWLNIVGTVPFVSMVM